jgi:hypothetical protein
MGELIETKGYHHLLTHNYKKTIKRYIMTPILKGVKFSFLNIKQTL